MAEVSGGIGFGPVGGAMIALDRKGVSLITFGGIQGGLVLSAGGTVAGLVYDGPRSGLVGWGGAMNLSGAKGLGVEYEFVMSSGSTGHQVGPAGGAGFSVSAELTRSIEVGAIDLSQVENER